MRGSAGGFLPTENPNEKRNRFLFWETVAFFLSEISAAHLS